MIFSLDTLKFRCSVYFVYNLRELLLGTRRMRLLHNKFLKTYFTQSWFSILQYPIITLRSKYWEDWEECVKYTSQFCYKKSRFRLPVTILKIKSIHIPNKYTGITMVACSSWSETRNGLYNFIDCMTRLTLVNKLLTCPHRV